MSAALAIILLCFIPPLRDEAKLILDTAFDGRDHQEEPFATLIKDVRQWGADIPGDAPVRLSPDYELMIESPGDYRGDVCRIEGVIQQQTPLGGVWAGVSEWFVRDDDGTPVIVFVVDPPTPPTSVEYRDGQRVTLFARFYKRHDAVARDGVERQYAAFVGAPPVEVARGGSSATSGGSVGADPLQRLWMVGVPVVGLLLVFALVRIAAKRSKSRQPVRMNRRIAADDEPDDAGALPEDPVDALEEMRRRSQ